MLKSKLFERLTRTIFILFAFLCVIVWLYADYVSITADSVLYKYKLLTGFGFAISSCAFFLPLNHRINLAISLMSALFTVYALNLALIVWTNPILDTTFHSQRIERASLRGTSFDTRSKLSVVEQRTLQGIDVVPWVSIGAMINSKKW